MRNLRFLHLFISVALATQVGVFSHQALGQVRPSRTIDNPNPNNPPGPIRPGRTVKEDQVKVSTKTEFARAVANPRPNKGYLSVVAFPAATVTLTRLPENKLKRPAVKQVIKAEDGDLNLIDLLPGKYKLVIEHEDYHPYSGDIQVNPARPEAFIAFNKMVSKYGEIRIGVSTTNAKIFLDEAPITPPRLKVENQNAVIPKVPVGKHRLRISKPGYVDFAQEIEVLPGETAVVPVQLDLALVTLNLTSAPGARVYVGSAEKGAIPPDGKLTISLAEGRSAIRVMKDGYEEWKKELILSLANSPVTERVELIPIPNSAEGDWDPSQGAKKWSPQPAGWRFDASGALIKGDKLVLFDMESSREFNIYRDFNLEFDVVFANGKGVAWVARAKDPNNYYLFEISGLASGKPALNFYVCQDGKLEWKDSRSIVEKIDKPGDSFQIIFEARGNRFETRMNIARAASEKPRPVGIFHDDSFSYGGVGFRGKDQSESLLKALFVIPQ
jgi:hypothetical protein